MVQRHDSTPPQRAQVVCQMIAHAGDYGLVTRLSRDLGVFRARRSIPGVSAATRPSKPPSFRCRPLPPVTYRCQGPYANLALT